MIGVQWMKHSHRMKFKDPFWESQTAGSVGEKPLNDYAIYTLFVLPHWKFLRNCENIFYNYFEATKQQAATNQTPRSMLQLKPSQIKAEISPKIFRSIYQLYKLIGTTTKCILQLQFNSKIINSQQIPNLISWPIQLFQSLTVFRKRKFHISLQRMINNPHFNHSIQKAIFNTLIIPILLSINSELFNFLIVYFSKEEPF
jgi:hypothetical protein